MSDPSEALQIAVAGALLAAAPVVELVGDRVLDPIAAQGADYPLVEVGQGQFVPDNGECFDSGLSYETIHVWADDQQARLVAKRIAARVAAVLAPRPPAPLLDVPGFRVLSALLHDVRHMDDGDATEAAGMVAHSVLTFQFRVEAAA